MIKIFFTSLILIIILTNSSTVMGQEVPETEIVVDTTLQSTDDTSSSFIKEGEEALEYDKMFQIEGIGKVADTTTQTVKSEVETADTNKTTPQVQKPFKQEILLSLEQGYKSVAWGTSKELLSSYVNVDSNNLIQTGETVSFRGMIGTDPVKYTYYFSPKGFWKVKIDYDVQGKSLQDYIDHFIRIEKLIAKRYGPPKRTTRNELGTDREYLFSRFPKLTHAYFRSSWQVSEVNVELLLHAHVPKTQETIPVFNDLTPSLILYYYHPFYYISKISQTPTPSATQEETIFESY